MPSKAGPTLVTGLHSASTARASAHPYANAHSNGRTSRRTDSVDDDGLLISPTMLISPTDDSGMGMGSSSMNMMATPTSASAPRPRKKANASASSSNPKSSRQQFSACHACRYRRVKCDLKDLSETTADASAEISCTNCRERGIRCKDDYAESKKQLRRGKRINQLELEDNLTEQADESSSWKAPLRPQTTIPNLKPEFFDSPFYRRFYIQRPIIDPVEFRSRYVAWLQHQLVPESNASLSSAAAPLSVEGQLLAKILVVWAAAYGVDEAGAEQPENSTNDVQKRRLRVKDMIEEVMKLIDTLSLLRKPSWDGVRCLLLALPLTEDVLDNPMNRLAMYEAAVQQVYTLCQHDGVTTGLSAETRAANAMVRARIFWYAHVHEGLTTGLRGGRLLMDEDDLRTFQKELPPAPSVFVAGHGTLQPTNTAYSLALQYATAPIRLASACRKVHAALTGPKARAAKRLDGAKLDDAWESLMLSWEEFEGLRPIQRSDHVTNEDTMRFVDGWQIFIFECHNVIQEKIRDRLDSARAAKITELEQSPDSPATVDALIRDLNKYLAIAESKCFDLLEHVVSLIRRHLGTTFFAYDASLVRDGCFFAGHTLALMPGRGDDVKVCLRALSEMRWAFSKGHERSQSIKLAWKAQGEYQGLYSQSSPEAPPEGRWTPNNSDKSSSHGHGVAHPSRMTPPNPTFPSPPPPQQFHVSSLPSHTAPSMMANSYVAVSRNQANLGAQLSPTHRHPPRPVGSTHSSSSDGSSPPEINQQFPNQYPAQYRPPMTHYDRVGLQKASLPLHTSLAQPPGHPSGYAQYPSPVGMPMNGSSIQQYHPNFTAHVLPHSSSSLPDTIGFVPPVPQPLIGHRTGLPSHTPNAPSNGLAQYAHEAGYMPPSTDAAYAIGYQDRTLPHRPDSFVSYGNNQIYYPPP